MAPPLNARPRPDKHIYMHVWKGHAQTCSCQPPPNGSSQSAILSCSSCSLLLLGLPRRPRVVRCASWSVYPPVSACPFSSSAGQ